MKKYFVTVILVVLIIVAHIFKKSQKDIILLNDDINIESTLAKKNEDYVQLYVYNKENSKIEKIELNVENKEFFSVEYYVNLVIKNSKFLHRNMNLLAVYEIDDNAVLIKLNEEFKKLNIRDFEILKQSMEKTIVEIFPNVKKIIVQIDTNN